MYPFLHLWWFSLSMTWLGIVSFLVVFIFIAQKRSALHGVQFRALLHFLPLIIMSWYLLGTRSWYFRSDFIVFPFDPKLRLLYISPYEYHFHFTGLLIGLSFGWYKFLQAQRRETHVRRRTILFESVCLASIPLWIFLLFGDNFIGKPIDSWRFLSAIDPLSKVAVYDKVIPLWLYLSAWSGLLYLLISFLNQWKKNIYRAFPWLMLYRVLMWYLLMRQIYPRHLVMKVGESTIDVKQYLCFGLIILIARQWNLVQNSSSFHSKIDETDHLNAR